MRQIVITALCLLALVSCTKTTPVPQVGTVTCDTINDVPCCVYLPYQYADRTDEVFPVLYLQHGMWGNEFDWTEKGNLTGIMDSVTARSGTRDGDYHAG